MQLHLRSVRVTGVWVECNSALKGIELHCIAFKGIELRAVNLGTMDRGEGGGRDAARLDDHQGPQDCCILSPHSHQVVLRILRWKMQGSFPFFSRSDLRGRWVLVTIITITSSPHGRCMCMMHNFAVHQFVTSRAALTSYLHHFILPGWHGCISSLTSIRQRLRLGNLSLVIYVLDDDRSQNLSNRRIWFSWPPHIPQVDSVPHSSPTMVASNRKPGIIGCVFSRPDILDLKYSEPQTSAHLSWLKLVLTQLFAQHRKSWTFGDRAFYLWE